VPSENLHHYVVLFLSIIIIDIFAHSCALCNFFFQWHGVWLTRKLFFSVCRCKAV